MNEEGEHVSVSGNFGLILKDNYFRYYYFQESYEVD